MFNKSIDLNNLTAIETEIKSQKKLITSPSSLPSKIFNYIHFLLHNPKKFLNKNIENIIAEYDARYKFSDFFFNLEEFSKTEKNFKRVFHAFTKRLEHLFDYKDIIEHCSFSNEFYYKDYERCKEKDALTIDFLLFCEKFIKYSKSEKSNGKESIITNSILETIENSDSFLEFCVESKNFNSYLRLRSEDEGFIDIKRFEHLYNILQEKLDVLLDKRQAIKKQLDINYANNTIDEKLIMQGQVLSASINNKIKAIVQLAGFFLQQKNNMNNLEQIELHNKINDVMTANMTKYVSNIDARSNRVVLDFYNKTIKPTPEQFVECYNLLYKQLLDGISKQYITISPNSQEQRNYIDETNSALSDWSRDYLDYLFDLNRKGRSEELYTFVKLCAETKCYSLFFSEIMFNKKRKENCCADIVNTFISQNKQQFVTYLINPDKYGFKLDAEKAMSIYYKEHVDAAYAISKIIDELIEEENLVNNSNINYGDIRKIGEGSSSTVYSVGDKVLKIGNGRVTPKIPYHRRILQPIIRMPIDGVYIEVTEKTSSNCVSRKEQAKIFYELLEDGIVCTDMRDENLGILKKDNIPTLHGERFYSDEHATGIHDRLDEEPLKSGEAVILDADYIYKVGDPNIKWPPDITGEIYKEMYQNWLKLHKKDKSSTTQDGPNRS